jgi:hypothetical protein
MPLPDTFTVKKVSLCFYFLKQIQSAVSKAPYWVKIDIDDHEKHRGEDNDQLEEVVGKMKVND